MKITDFGVAIDEDDSHLSKWIVEQRRLDVNAEFCKILAPYIHKGSTVIDAGACLGDHTITFCEMVGETGKVIAFEPNPKAYEMLAHNLAGWNRRGVARLFKVALGSSLGWGQIRLREEQPENLGACRVEQVGNSGTVMIITLDSFPHVIPKLDFMKIDVEGMEPNVLLGATHLIHRCKPVLLIEMNRPVLEKRGYTPESILRLLDEMNYSYKPVEPHIPMESDQFDLLSWPK